MLAFNLSHLCRCALVFVSLACCAQGQTRRNEGGVLDKLLHSSEAQNSVNSTQTRSGGPVQVANGRAQGGVQHAGGAYQAEPLKAASISNSPTAIPKVNGSESLAAQHRESFLERAKQQTTSNTPITEQINKIGLNLIIVLVIAAGASLFLKQFQKSKSATAEDSQSQRANRLKVLGEAKVDKNTSLTLVQFRRHQILLVRDSYGTKSMQLIPPSFEDSLSQADHVREPDSEVTRFDEEEDTSDIDEQLLKLFVQKSRNAA